MVPPVPVEAGESSYEQGIREKGKKPSDLPTFLPPPRTLKTTLIKSQLKEGKELLTACHTLYIDFKRYVNNVQIIIKLELFTVGIYE